MATRTIRRAKSGATALPPNRKTIPHVDLDEDFSDVSGDPGTEFTLVDGKGETIGPEGDSTYRYLFADRNDSQFGPSYWKRALPPREEVHFDGTVTIKGVTFAEGDRIESRDLVLMRASRALCEKRERYERNKRAIDNRRMALAAQDDIDLTGGDGASVLARHRTSSNLNYREA